MSALALQSFGFGDQLVRVANREDVAWFVAKDVCSVLEIVNHKDAVRRLESDERDEVGITDAIGREQKMTVVSESGVFALIFRSRKPAARAFRKWVTSEVLPAIRRTGRFDGSPANDDGALPMVPDAPDQVDRLRLSLTMIREARIAFGAKAARKAWLWAGLPDLSEPDQVDALVGDRYPTLARWFDERAVVEPGSRTSSSVLWADYLDWCKANGIRLQAMHSTTALGRFLSDIGCFATKDRDGLKVRMDVRLKG